MPRKRALPVRSAGACAERLNALAEPTRLAVIEALMGGPRHVGNLVQLLKVEQSLMSHHLQTLRDEVHRFAIGAHRAKRSRAITASPLDEIPGIGPGRKRALLLHFGTAGKVRAAALEDLKRTPGISAGVAQKIWDFYHPSG
jgi:ERCC4-type nuclease